MMDGWMRFKRLFLKKARFNVVLHARDAHVCEYLLMKNPHPTPAQVTRGLLETYAAVQAYSYRSGSDRCFARGKNP